uniref:Uncharacterized protein n=1 Tax=viral metagenome TaxID=1070528 RepID=A0A6C0FL16_9ZZZZ|tara:strand:+ start:26572 stop:27069 length:498 start_codon:yes stop_codon:yes gene_type:complete
MLCVQILKDDTMKEVKVKGNNILKNLTKLSINNDSITELYTWTYENITTKCYGSYDGDAGFENKHELPPNGISNFLEEDSSEKLLFGDIFIMRFEGDKLINTSISDYGEFYNLIFNNFDDCLSDEEEQYEYTDEEYTTHDSETDEEYEFIKEDSDDNLEIDTTEY